ncbi:cbb3-type cytochrome c oxidase subunit I [Pedosphaera parvula]|uniref:Cytochrome c oxidase subunit I n=1 Tax=Pedosphaera parvula (strain Ellin514) TaxID=320771 RepID=B9XE36_PEDPL|nr:cbb3-type cytochrome c oxidase subunit I [Pedosphaera parvula]EEF61927.1 cytochrome c oxidase subunit I [Pedosphaera parvula Ellin514]
MSATPSTKQPISTSNGDALTAVPGVEIDASCRPPVMLLFVSAAVWLLLSSVFGIIASMTFHKASMLGDTAAMTYGRMHPAALNALVYGFAIQAGLGVGLWMLSHLGRTRLAMTPVIVLGAILWNIGMTLGIGAIFYGDSAGFEWLEFPRYSSALLFVGYLSMGLGAIVTFHLRRERSLYISQWLLAAAILWFPWIYSTAQLLLLVHPVRGVMQAVIDWWYINNLTTIWLGFTGLAAVFYFIPKITGRALYSHYLGVFIFWILAIFGSWGGIPNASPLPRWIPALSGAAVMISLVAVAGVAVNVWKSISGSAQKPAGGNLIKFIVFGGFAYVVASLAGAILCVSKGSEILNFTWFLPAQSQLMIYGFFAMTMFGAVYFISGKLLQVEVCAGKIKAHFWLAALGVIVYAVALAAGGVQQGSGLSDAHATSSFLEIAKGTIPFIRASTMGDMLMAIANLLFLVNLIGILVRVGRTGYTAAMVANTKTAGVRS